MREQADQGEKSIKTQEMLIKYMKLLQINMIQKNFFWK